MAYNIDFKEQATRDLIALAKHEPKAFLKAQAFFAAQVVSLPVASAVRAFTPVFFYIASVYDQLV